jgi:hypothetical protein
MDGHQLNGQRGFTARLTADALVSPGVRYVQLVIFTLAGFLAGVVIGLLFRRFPPAWVEAVGTWFAGFVALFAVILAVIAFRSEEFARRLDQAQANRTERAMLQHEADLVVCEARVGFAELEMLGGAKVLRGELEGDLVAPSELNIYAKNNSSLAVTDVRCQVSQLGDDWIKLSDLLLPGDDATERIPVTKPFKVHTDNRELHESATFRFSLGRVRWTTQYGQLAERVDP